MIEARHYWTKDRSYYEGVIIKTIPKRYTLSKEDINLLEKTHDRKSDLIKNLLLKPSNMERYLVIFNNSLYIHIYYEDQLKTIIKHKE